MPTNVHVIPGTDHLKISINDPLDDASIHGVSNCLDAYVLNAPNLYDIVDLSIQSPGDSFQESARFTFAWTPTSSVTLETTATVQSRETRPLLHFLNQLLDALKSRHPEIVISVKEMLQENLERHKTIIRHEKKNHPIGFNLGNQSNGGLATSISRASVGRR